MSQDFVVDRFQSNAQEPYSKLHIVLSVSKRMGEGLVPPRIQVFVDNFAFIELFPFEFEFHIRVTGACRIKQISQMLLCERR